MSADPGSRAADPLAEFYDETYSRRGAEAELYGRWRALSAVGKADHVTSLCARGGLVPASTLDVGCGDGALLSELSGRGFGGRLAGVEITEAAVALASSRPAIDAVALYDGAHLPFAAGSFDLGIVSHVLEHVRDPAGLLAEVARVCRAVVAEVPLERNLSAARAGKRRHGDEVGHLHLFDRDAMRQVVSAAGLRVASEISDPLPLAVHTFFTRDGRTRATGTAKWLVRTSLHAAAPGLARRLFTVHYACLCV